MEMVLPGNSSLGGWAIQAQARERRQRGTGAGTVYWRIEGGEGDLSVVGSSRIVRSDGGERGEGQSPQVSLFLSVGGITKNTAACIRKY